jgi:glucose/arabinose dehydrogenase
MKKKENYRYMRKMITGCFMLMCFIGVTSCDLLEDLKDGKDGNRILDPSSLNVPEGFEVEVFAQDLTYPTDMIFGSNGEVYVAESGAHFYGTNPKEAPPARILQLLPGGGTKVIYDNNVPYTAIRAAQDDKDIPEGIIGPLEGITFNHQNGLIYVAHRTRISTLNPKTGEFKTIIGGLPAWGIFHNSKVIFNDEGKMVFEVSTQANSGPVDKPFMEVISFYNKPDKREIPCETVTLTGKAYPVVNLFTEEKGDTVMAPVYQPYYAEAEAGKVIEGEFWCNGGVYISEPDGSNPRRIAWGFRDPFHLEYSPAGRLILTNNGGEAFPNRPIYDDWDTFYEVEEGKWYGWPDYYSGVPVTNDRFRRPNDPDFQGEPFEHDFVLTEETRQRLLNGQALPPQPLVRMEPPHIGAQGFVFGKQAWGMDPENEVFLAEFGTLQFFTTVDEGIPPGFLISKVNLQSGARTPWITNKVVPASASPAPELRGPGFERPLRLVWGPDESLYLVDFGTLDSNPVPEKERDAKPKTGVIWKISKKK